MALLTTLRGQPSKVALAITLVGATLVLDALVRGPFHVFAVFACVPLLFHARGLAGWAAGFDLERDRIVVRGPRHLALPIADIVAVQLSERRSHGAGGRTWSAVILWARVAGRMRSFLVDGVAPDDARAFVREVATLTPLRDVAPSLRDVGPSLVGWLLGLLAAGALLALALGVTPSPGIVGYVSLVTAIVHGPHLRALVDREGAFALWRSFSSNPRRALSGPYRV